jgi:hypothetical protein
MINSTKAFIGILAAVWFFCGSVTAQDFSSLAPVLPQISTIIKKISGAPPSFSANATVELTEAGSTNSMIVMPSKFTFADNKMRWDLDAGQMSGSIMSPEASLALRNAKLDQICFIERLDKKAEYVVFPGAQAYLNVPIPESELSNTLEKAENIKLKTEVLGKETLDGYDCTKSRITVPAEANLHEEAIVWSASELKNYPIKLEIDTRAGRVAFHFRDVKFDAPPAGVFEVATNFACRASSQEIMDFAGQQQKQGGVLNPPRSSDDGVEARILHFGITTSGNGIKVDAPDDPTGKHLLFRTGTLALKTETNRIPARVGVSFGCYSEVSGLFSKFGERAEVEITWTYPPMVKRDGSISKGFTFKEMPWVNHDGVARCWAGYRFDNDFELVPGAWRLDVRYEGKTLATQIFTVFLE